jgi:hypothetical protein
VLRLLLSVLPRLLLLLMLPALLLLLLLRGGGMALPLLSAVGPVCRWCWGWCWGGWAR